MAVRCTTPPAIIHPCTICAESVHHNRQPCCTLGLTLDRVFKGAFSGIIFSRRYQLTSSLTYATLALLWYKLSLKQKGRQSNPFLGCPAVLFAWAFYNRPFSASRTQMFRQLPQRPKQCDLHEVTKHCPGCIINTASATYIAGHRENGRALQPRPPDIRNSGNRTSLAQSNRQPTVQIDLLQLFAVNHGKFFRMGFQETPYTFIHFSGSSRIHQQQKDRIITCYFKRTMEKFPRVNIRRVHPHHFHKRTDGKTVCVGKARTAAQNIYYSFLPYISANCRAGALESSIACLVIWSTPDIAAFISPCFVYSNSLAYSNSFIRSNACTGQR